MLEVDIHKEFKVKNRTETVQCKASFQPGKTTALFGKSGIGKTTILRTIAGLESPSKGGIKFKESHWEEIPLKDRPVGMVFQDFNLFRNMTIEQNLAYAEGGLISENTQSLIGEFKIRELLTSYPDQLSKGQQQKAAILRSITAENEILLLDEPFSALDDESILDIMEVIEKLKSEMNLIIILVTHRKDVILKMADSVVMMSSENCIQGNPKELIQLSF